jgi:hypothetical protein
MKEAMKSLGLFVVLVFFAAQFVATSCRRTNKNPSSFVFLCEEVLSMPGAIGVAAVLIPGVLASFIGLPARCPEVLGSWPFGHSRAVVAADHALYFSSGRAIYAVDMANQSEPQVQGHVVFSDTPIAIFPEGDLLFVAAGRAGLRIVDVTTPSLPVEIGSFDSYEATDVLVSGTQALLLDAYSGLIILDVSLPTAPRALGRIDTAGDSAVAIDVSGSYACVVDEVTGLHVVNISDTTNPLGMGSFNPLSTLYDVIMVDSTALLAGSWGLFAVDISDPAAPYEEVLVSTTRASCKALARRGDRLFVAGYMGGLLIFDITTPSDPLHIASFTMQGETVDVAVLGSYAYVAREDLGLGQIIVEPWHYGWAIDTPGSLSAITTSGRYVYALDNHNNAEDCLRVFDIADPTSPVQLGSWSGPYFGRYIAASHGYVYFIMSGKLASVDVSEPGNPVLVDHIEQGGNYNRGIEVSGSYLFLADGGVPDYYDPGGLEVFSIKDPRSPVQVASYATSDALALHVSGSTVYLADREGFQLIDVRAPTSPELLGVCPSVTTGISICTWSHYAFVACYNAGVQVINVSDPRSPAEIAAYDMQGCVYDVDAIEHYPLIVVSFTSREPGVNGVVKVLDVSVPLNPVEIGVIQGSQGVIQTAIAGSYGFLLQSYRGFQVADLGDCIRTSRPIPRRVAGRRH